MKSKSCWTSNPKFFFALVTAFSFIVMLLLMLDFPRDIYDASHDSSSAAMFDYLAAKKFQFGSEVYLNVGPFGYVDYSNIYFGDQLLWKKIILKNFWRVVLIGLIFWMMSQLTATLHKISWIGIIICLKVIEGLEDNLGYLTVYLLGLMLLQKQPDHKYYLKSIVAWNFLAFISLTKSTYFVMSSVVAIIICIHYAWHRKLVPALTGLVLFPVSLVVFWALSGQQINNLPSFLHGVFAFCSNYNEAMSIPAPVKGLIAGLILIALLIWTLTSNFLCDRKNIGKILIDSCFVFVLWKNGFVRADLHILIFFYGVLLLTIPILYYRQHDANQHHPVSPAQLRLTHSRSIAIIFLCSATVGYVKFINRHDTSPPFYHAVLSNISWLSSPANNVENLRIRLKAMKASQVLPNIKQAVGNKSIDCFGSSPGPLFLNELQYFPRPMPISFAAFNWYFQKANELYYRDPKKAPQFVLYQYGGVDNRLTAQDDALAQRALFDNYSSLFQENGLLLMQRKDAGLFRAEGHEKTTKVMLAQFGQHVPVPASPDNSVQILSAEVEGNLLYKVLSFLYKPPVCQIGLAFKHTNQIQYHKYVTSMGRCGFVIKPYIAGLEDVSSLYAGTDNTTRPQVTGVVFKLSPMTKILFNNAIKIRFSVMPTPTASNHLTPV